MLRDALLVGHATSASQWRAGAGEALISRVAWYAAGAALWNTAASPHHNGAHRHLGKCVGRGTRRVYGSAHSAHRVASLSLAKQARSKDEMNSRSGVAIAPRRCRALRAYDAARQHQSARMKVRAAI
jgi:hypothetical protein